nr:hypothetical protein HK105_006887 [Polyrhizophydium stewartii]
MDGKFPFQFPKAILRQLAARAQVWSVCRGHIHTQDDVKKRYIVSDGKVTKPSPDSNGDYIQNAPGLKELEDGGFEYYCFFDLNSKNNAMIWIAPMHLYHDLVGERSWTKYDGKPAPNGTLFIKISKREFKQTRRIKWQQRVLQELQKRERRQRERDGKNDIFADMPSIKSTSVGDVWALFDFLAADGQTAANNMEGAGCRFGEIMRFYARHVFRRMHMESHSAKQPPEARYLDPWPDKNYEAKNLLMIRSLRHCGHCDIT